MMKDLGLGPNDIASLQKMEWSKLVAAGNAAVAKINPPMQGPGLDSLPEPATRGLVASVDGKSDQHAVVLRCCAGNLEERADAAGLGERRGQPDGLHVPPRNEWHANLVKAYGEDKATALIAALKKAYPEKSIRTLSYMCSGSFGLNGLAMRNNIVKMAKLKHEQKGAPAYAYYFTWQSPMLDGVAGAWHTAELAILLRQHQALRTGHGQYARGAGAGNEDGRRHGRTSPGPETPASRDCRGHRRIRISNKTMVWDNEIRMVDDPESEARKIL